jgi:uncharacterized protein YegL
MTLDLNVGARTPVTPCILLLDLSGSMNDPVRRGGPTRIAALNDGLRTLCASLDANSEARRRVEIAVVSVGGVESPSEVKVVHEFLAVKDFKPLNFDADGETRLGEGVMVALDILKRRLDQLNAQARGVTRPWLFILSDGEPTDEDNWPIAVRMAHDAQLKKRCVVAPFLIEGADAPKLDDLVQGAVPKLRLDEFSLFFKWVSRRVSIPVTGKDTKGAKPVDPFADWEVYKQQEPSSKNKH